MKNEHLLLIFSLFTGLSLIYTWFYLSKPSLQIGGALYGIPGTDPITPIMAAFIVIWFMLMGLVVYLNKP